MRLTDVERAERRMSEADLEKLVTDLAEVLGWQWLHVGALRTKFGWRVPSRGPLAKGWVDLFLIRVRDGRRLAVELKRQLEPVRADQAAVLASLELVGIQTEVWRPSDVRDPLEESRAWQVLR